MRSPLCARDRSPCRFLARKEQIHDITATHQDQVNAETLAFLQGQPCYRHEGEVIMKIVVIGGTGLIGSKLVAKLVAHGHDAVPASPGTGVNTLTGEGLTGALARADVVVDVSNSPSFEDTAVLEFFEKSTRNILDAEARQPAWDITWRCRSSAPNGWPKAAT